MRLKNIMNAWDARGIKATRRKNMKLINDRRSEAPKRYAG